MLCFTKEGADCKEDLNNKPLRHKICVESGVLTFRVVFRSRTADNNSYTMSDISAAVLSYLKTLSRVETAKNEEEAAAYKQQLPQPTTDMFA